MLEVTKILAEATTKRTMTIRLDYLSGSTGESVTIEDKNNKDVDLEFASKYVSKLVLGDDLGIVSFIDGDYQLLPSNNKSSKKFKPASKSGVAHVSLIISSMKSDKDALNMGGRIATRSCSSSFPIKKFNSLDSAIDNGLRKALYDLGICEYNYDISLNIAMLLDSSSRVVESCTGESCYDMKKSMELSEELLKKHIRTLISESFNCIGLELDLVIL
jgi:hypothetical protein